MVQHLHQCYGLLHPTHYSTGLRKDARLSTGYPVSASCLCSPWSKDYYCYCLRQGQRSYPSPVSVFSMVCVAAREQTRFVSGLHSEIPKHSSSVHTSAYHVRDGGAPSLEDGEMDRVDHENVNVNAGRSDRNGHVRYPGGTQGDWKMMHSHARTVLALGFDWNEHVNDNQCREGMETMLRRHHPVCVRMDDGAVLVESWVSGVGHEEVVVDETANG